MTNDSNHRRHRASATEDDDEAAEETRQRHVKVPTRYLHVLSHRNPLPIHLLMAGWNRLESVPRWMIERTLGFVVPVVSLHHHHHHHHNHNHHHSSSMVRRVLEQSDNEWDMEALKQKYAKEIKADSELQDMQKRIRAMKQQLQQQRTQRERQEKKQAAWREKEQKQLEHATTKLHHALEQLLLGKSARSTTRDYSKAISRAGNRGKAKRVNSGSSSHHHHHGSSGSSSSYVKTVSKAAVAAATTPIALASSAVTTVTTTAAATISSTSTEQLNKLTPEQRECLELETTILRHMHQTMIFQNQCDIAEASSKQVTSALKRERALLDTQQAQVAMMQMVLDGTQRALHDIYPEVVLRQESILERVILAAASSSSSSEEGETAMLTAIPRLIAPSFQQEGGAVFVPSSSFRLSNRTMDGISDLGESVKGSSFDNDASSSVGEDSFHNNTVGCQPMMYYGKGPPVFTSVRALQQHTLQQHMASGVESF